MDESLVGSIGTEVVLRLSCSLTPRLTYGVVKPEMVLVAVEVMEAVDVMSVSRTRGNMWLSVVEVLEDAWVRLRKPCFLVRL